MCVLVFVCLSWQEQKRAACPGVCKKVAWQMCRCFSMCFIDSVFTH